jgi:hypothetical protein
MYIIQIKNLKFIYIYFRYIWGLLGDEKMGDKTQKEVINQEATQKSLPPSGNVDFTALKEQIDNILKQQFGMTIEEFNEAQRKQEEARREQLKQELQKINEEIQKLMQRKAEIQKQLGINKMPRTRTGTTGISDTIGLRFTLDGIEMPASAIARELGLSKNSAVNWKKVFISVLSGNSAGLTSEEQNEVRNRVSIIQ